MADRRAIGMFDSGVGGLSVMREIRRLLSREDILYLADTAHCPYGTRTREEIQQLTGAIAEFLISQGAKLIVVACNTASVASLPYLRAKFSVPFVGMVPAVKPAASASQARRVGVMATNATFQGEMFDDLVQRFAADVQVVKQVCPGLVHASRKVNWTRWRPNDSWPSTFNRSSRRGSTLSYSDAPITSFFGQTSKRSSAQPWP